jgi:glucokinase
MLTLGTGVGGAVLIDGKVRTGTIQRLGHLGHISLNVRGRADSTNIPGSLEDAVADKTLYQRSNGLYSSTQQLIEAVTAGSEHAERIWQTSLRHLAAGIASLINVLDPAVVILGGGIIAAGELLFAPLAEMLSEFEWRPGGHSVAVKPAELGDYAGAIGAARFAVLYSSDNP